MRSSRRTRRFDMRDRSMTSGLTVAIPTFGRGRFLSQTLNSIEDQTVPTIASVVGGSIEFDVSQYAGGFVSFENRDPDPGMVACWNGAAESSNTSFLSFLADDNLLEPGFAETMTRFLDRHRECDVAFCNLRIINGNGELQPEESVTTARFYGRDQLSPGRIPDSLLEQLIARNSLPLEASVIRREVWDRFGPFDSRAEGAFDMHFFGRLLRGGTTFGFVSDFLVRFRYHDDCYSVNQKQKHLEGAVWALKDLQRVPSDFVPAFRKRLAGCQSQLLDCISDPIRKRQLMGEVLGGPSGPYLILRYLAKRALRSISVTNGRNRDS